MVRQAVTANLLSGIVLSKISPVSLQAHFLFFLTPQVFHFVDKCFLYILIHYIIYYVYL